MYQRTTLVLITLALVSNIAYSRTPDSEYVCPNGVWTGQKCKTCIHNNQSSCSTCDPSRYWSQCTTEASKNYGISGCEEGCLSSGTKTSVCTKCNENGYYKETGLCHACPNDCQTCSGRSNCNECDDNFYISNGQCIKAPNLGVPAFCRKWASQTDCKVCKPKYWLESSTQCSNCSTNCETCTNASSCTKCQGKYILSDGKCTTQCSILNCAECSLEGTTTQCTKCYSSHYLNAADSTCKAQPNFCQTESSSDPAKCQVCIDGYSLNATTNLCESCTTPTGVLRCRDGAQELIQCQDGYALTPTGTTGALTCTQITALDTQYCKTHQTASICETCYSDYILSAGQCVTCNGEGCLQCTAGTDTVAYTCTRCQDGYYLPTGTTTQCNFCSGNSNLKLGCKCDNTGKCTDCMPGYYSQTTTPSLTCDKCQDDACLSCDSENPEICNSCKQEYYLYYAEGEINTQNQCKQCDAGCKECAYSGSCVTCNDSSRLDPDTQTCVYTGVKQSDGQVALECHAGFVLSNGICKNCFVDGVSKCPSACTDNPATGGIGGTQGGNSSILTVLISISFLLLNFF